MGVRKFEEIEAWQAARALVKEVYDLRRTSRLGGDAAPADQMCRAAISIMANIAEGFDNTSNAEFLRFPGYAGRSATELRSHLYVAFDQGYLESKKSDELLESARKARALIGGFARALRKRGDVQ